MRVESAFPNRRHLKRTASHLCLILFLFHSYTISHAQEHDFAVVNISKVLSSTAAGREITAGIERFLKERSSELRKKEDDLRVRQNNLLNLRSVLEDSEYQKLYHQVEREVQKFLEEKNKVLEEFAEFNSSEMQKFAEMIQPVLTKLSQNRKVRIIVNVAHNDLAPWRKPVLYYDESIDITPLVIKSLETLSSQKQK